MGPGGGRNLYGVLDVPAPSARLCGMLYAQLTGTLGTVQQGHGRALQQCTAQLRGLAGACKRCGQRSVPRPEQGTELLCGSACNSLWNRKKNSEKPIRQYKTIQDKKGQDKTETIEKKRKPADVPAAVVAATIGLAEVSGIAKAPIAAFAVPAAPSSGRRKGYFRYVRMQAGRHWWTKYRPTVSGWR